MDARIDSLLAFWFGRPEPGSREELDRQFDRWFVADAGIDAEIDARFGEAARLAARGELDAWRHDAKGRLALILLLDQMPRHLHRGTAAAFAQDEKAVGLVIEGIAAGVDAELSVLERAFFYMPLQHAENAETQALSVRMFEKLRNDVGNSELHGPMLDGMLKYARLHHEIVERFGRFPHRNDALGRADTDAERVYLRDGGPRFGQ
jgi:uncharacterized protein (DUF924 family)